MKSNGPKPIPVDTKLGIVRGENFHAEQHVAMICSALMIRRNGFFRAAMIVSMAIVCGLSQANATTKSQRWLIVSDIHVDPLSKATGSIAGRDSSPALVASAIAAMRRVNPHPPLAIIVGDYLAHAFDPKRAIPTMVAVARQFDRAFPQTQFVLVLGNEDSDCGDYAVATNSPFLRAVARAWSPLVNRHGAAPTFEKTFARDGSYVATLPLAGYRAVVLNDVFWSPRYRSACGGSANPSLQMQRDLESALPRSGRGHAWVFAHIPPGIDAFSTAQLSHDLLAVPLLRQRAKDRFVSLIGDPSRRVTMVVAGHTHRFAFRVIGTGRSAVPILLAPAISPIFGNAPSFLSASIDAGGAIESLDEWSLLHGTWRDLGGLDALRMHGLTGAGVIDLQWRLLRDAGIQRAYARLYGGGSRSEIDRANARVYWCVMTALSTSAFRDCTAEGGIGIITNKGLRASAALALLFAVAAVCCFVVVRFVRRRSGRISSPR